MIPCNDIYINLCLLTYENTLSLVVGPRKCLRVYLAVLLSPAVVAQGKLTLA